MEKREKTSPVLILFKEENEEKVSNAVHESLKPYFEREEPEPYTCFGETRSIRDSNLKLMILNIRFLFNSYQEFDNFLIGLVSEKGLFDFKSKGVLIGHFDENGGLWSDYTQNSFIQMYKWENDQ